LHRPLCITGKGHSWYSCYDQATRSNTWRIQRTDFC
jgi:hypothetical protein